MQELLYRLSKCVIEEVSASYRLLASRYIMGGQQGKEARASVKQRSDRNKNCARLLTTTDIFNESVGMAKLFLFLHD
jgi:hypothetical protein